MPEPSPFGSFVKRLREARGYSQADVTQRGGLSDGHLGMIETGQRGKRVSRDIVLRLVAGLRASDEDRDEMLRLAGYPPASDLPPTPDFVQSVNADARLRADQKRALLDLYAVMVR